MIYKGYFANPRSENPRVGGSILSRPTIISFKSGGLRTLYKCPFFFMRNFGAEKSPLQAWKQASNLFIVALYTQYFDGYTAPLSVF